MSTSYYYLREPITKLRVTDKLKGIVVLEIWVQGYWAGELVLDQEHLPAIVRHISQQEDDDSHAPMRTHWGGKDVGAVVTENVKGLDPALTLVSEYGELMTVAEIQGKGWGQAYRWDANRAVRV